ncbi:MAG: hypothetical protein K2Q20_07185, partial [Phycisphaerales bacterium]|nr:hypothetical protein [Phycisphaerales bacterium]
VRSGDLSDYAQAAELGFVTRARVSQIIDLCNLAPAIQEELLSLRIPLGNRDSPTERQMRAVVRHASWERQIAAWKGLKQGLLEGSADQ